MTKKRRFVQKKLNLPEDSPIRGAEGAVKAFFIVLFFLMTGGCASKFSWMPKKFSQNAYEEKKKSRTPAAIRAQSRKRGLMRDVLSKYRAVLDDYNWEIRRSDAVGGFLEATRPETASDDSEKLILNLSCYHSDKKDVTCSVRIRKCKIEIKESYKHCAYMKGPTNKTLKKFLGALESI